MAADGSGTQSERIPVGGTGVSISIREIPVGDGGGSVRILVNGIPIKLQEVEMASGGKNKS